MQIEYMQAGPYANVELDGSVLHVAGISIDISARQADSQVIIDITQQGAAIVEGLGRQGSYVASILIPPKEYEDLDTGERRPLPLDTNRIGLKLWQLKPQGNPNRGGIA